MAGKDNNYWGNNDSGNKEDDQPNPSGIGSGNEGNNQVVENVPKVETPATDNVSGISGGHDTSRQQPTTSSNLSSSQGLLSGINAFKKTLKPTPTPVPVAQEAPEVKQPVAPVVETPAIPSTADKVDDYGIDFSKANEILKEGKITDIAELTGEVNRREQNAFNRLTHDALAQERDSGYTEAAKVATIRQANISQMDGMNSIKSEFNENMLKLELETAKSKFEAGEKRDLEKEQDFRDEIASVQAGFETLMETDPAAAMEYVLAFAATTDEVTPWDAYENPAIANAYIDSLDRDNAARYQEESLNEVIKLISNLDVNTDPANMARNRDRILELMKINPNLFIVQTRTQFSGMNGENFEEY